MGWFRSFVSWIFGQMPRDFPHAVSALADVVWTARKPGWVLFLDVDVYLHQKARSHEIDQTVDDCLLAEATDIRSNALALTRLPLELMGTGFSGTSLRMHFSLHHRLLLWCPGMKCQLYSRSSSHCTDVFLPILNGANQLPLMSA